MANILVIYLLLNPFDISVCDRLTSTYSGTLITYVKLLTYDGIFLVVVVVVVVVGNFVDYANVGLLLVLVLVLVLLSMVKLSALILATTLLLNRIGSNWLLISI